MGTPGERGYIPPAVEPELAAVSQEFPDLGQSALYCVTEVHTKADIDRLVAALGEVVA